VAPRPKDAAEPETGRETLRVIAGSLRGRALLSPPDGVRPTSDRVRESLFARLGDVGGCRVLDLCAGTGALGIEAISRGAEALVAVDQARHAIKTISRNLERLGIADRAEVVRSDARGAVRGLGARGLLFDLVFLDPPYAGDEIPEILAALLDTRVVTNEAVVVVESAKRHPLAPAEGFLVTAERTYGDTRITWLSPSVRRRSVDGTPQGRDRDQ
jgi:16S rRNA (guanine966-N2)-methyltransferase